MPLSVVSYNVLAAAYTTPGWYPQVPQPLLDRKARRADLIAHIQALDADVICLQEVEPAVHAALEVALLGYHGRFAQKGRGKPDGCATFVRAPLLITRWEVLPYDDAQDGEPASGHLALIAALTHDGRPLFVANTHLRWEPPETPPETSRAARQLGQLVAALRRLGPDAPWILCGDFNLTPQSEPLRALRAAGLRDAHEAQPEPRRTCYANGRTKAVDYLFYTPDLRATPAPLPEISNDTPLPSREQPSDHLALLASFERL